MALEAVQAQAIYPSVESTRAYLHLTNDWPAANTGVLDVADTGQVGHSQFSRGRSEP